MVSANTDVAANTAKVGITEEQANAIIANTANSSASIHPFYETYEFYAGGEEFEGTDEQIIGTHTITEGGYVGFYANLSLYKERNSQLNNVQVQIWNGSNQITINTIDDLSLTNSDQSAAGVRQLYGKVIGHFYVEDNTTLTIKGIYTLSGFNNYQNQGGGYGSFKAAIYR